MRQVRLYCPGCEQVQSFELSFAGCKPGTASGRCMFYSIKTQIGLRSEALAERITERLDLLIRTRGACPVCGAAQAYSDLAALQNEATVGRWMWNRMHHIEYNDEELKSEWVVGPEIVPPQV